MPTDHSNNKGKDTPKKPITRRNKNNPIIVAINTGESKVGTENPQSEINDERQNITINILQPQNDNTQAIRANKLAKRSILINAGLFAGTIALAIIGTCQYRSADNAAQTAQKTLTETKDYDKKSLQKQKELFDKQNEFFIKEHEPYIQVDVDSFKCNKEKACELIFQIVSSSERPIEQINSIYNMVSMPFTDTAQFLKHPFKKAPKRGMMRGKFYFFKDTKRKNAITIFDNPTNDIKNWIDNYGSYYAIYFLGKIKYKNYVTDKDRIYTFVMQLGYENKRLGGYYIINKNLDSK
jgi:hypothetical protein